MFTNFCSTRRWNKRNKKFYKNLVSTIIASEAYTYIGVLGLPFYFQGYRILSILLPGIWDTEFNIFVSFRYIEYLGKLIMGIFANL